MLLLMDADSTAAPAAEGLVTQQRRRASPTNARYTEYRAVPLIRFLTFYSRLEVPYNAHFNHGNAGISMCVSMRVASVARNWPLSACRGKVLINHVLKWVIVSAIL